MSLEFFASYDFLLFLPRILAGKYYFLGRSRREWGNIIFFPREEFLSTAIIFYGFVLRAGRLRMNIINFVDIVHHESTNSYDMIKVTRHHRMNNLLIAS